METGHAPFANQFEFSTAFVWGALATYVWFRVRFEIRDLALLVLPFSVAMLLYASSMGRTADPLIPALQNSLLLTLHVFSAVIAYGAAAISFAAAVLYLVHPHIPWRRLPAAEKLDEIGYRAVVLTFPMLTLMLILGALWADIAWGRYWNWDPKETSALVTWLIYGAYLHARVTAGWHGRRAAWLLVLGFAAVIFTFTGNHWFGGMHSYA
jgi:ABC-type transport system involved in cytochrome c biogenesis permease subunit